MEFLKNTDNRSMVSVDYLHDAIKEIVDGYLMFVWERLEKLEETNKFRKDVIEISNETIAVNPIDVDAAIETMKDGEGEVVIKVEDYKAVIKWNLIDSLSQFEVTLDGKEVKEFGWEVGSAIYRVFVGAVCWNVE